MITEEIVQNILKKIQSWESNQKIIIGIEGYSGTGKSTLLKKLANHMDFVAVHRDDFLIDREDFKNLLQASDRKEKIFEYNSVDYRAIIKLAQHFKEGQKYHTCTIRGDETTGSTSGKADQMITYDLTPNIMIVEGIWLFHPQLFDHVFDFRIYLHTDQEAADERRRQREMKKWGENYYPDTHPDNYFRLVKTAYSEYCEKYTPLQRADFVITV